MNDVPLPCECCVHFDMINSSQKDVLEVEKAYENCDKADQDFCMRRD